MTAQNLVAWERDKEARRRLAEYEADKQARRIRLGLEPQPETDLREVNGWIHEALTALEQLAGDLGDSDIAKLVAAQVNATVALGNLLARRREAHAGAGT